MQLTAVADELFHCQKSSFTAEEATKYSIFEIKENVQSPKEGSRSQTGEVQINISFVFFLFTVLMFLTKKGLRPAP